MKLNYIHMTNWLAHRSLKIEFDGFTVIGGLNEAGKSCVADGLRFSLLADLCRVEAKGHRDQLVSAGAKEGEVTTGIGEGHVTREVSTGKLLPSQSIGGIEGIHLPLVFPNLLDPSNFARLSGDDRRRLLTHVMRVGADYAHVVTMLDSRGLEPAVLTGWSKAGFDEGGFAWAAKLASDEAKASRAAWKGCTGETYGSDKAESWVSPLGKDAPEGEKPAEDALQVARQKVLDLQTTRADIIAADRMKKQRAGDIARWRKMIADGPFLEKEKMRLQDERAASADPRPAGVYDVNCPACGVVFALDKAHHHYEQPAGSLFDGEVRLKAIDAELAQIPGAKSALAVTPAGDEEEEDGLAELDQQLEEAEAEFSRVNGALNAWQHFSTVREIADKKTTDAKAHHEKVKAAVKLAEAFEPSGIPAELLAAALDPFNNTLGDLSGMARWQVVTIEPDMAITVRGRGYGLQSESMKWRADAIIAAAIAFHSGAKFIVADRFDVLDAPGRLDCIKWLRQALKNGILDSAVVLGTFKEEPKLPPDIKLVWLGPKPAKKAA